MAYIKCAENCIVLKINNPMTKSVSDILKLSSIQNGATVDPLDYVQMVGEVVSVPDIITNRFGLENYSCKNIKRGDIAIFRHDVIWDFVQKTHKGKLEFRNAVFFEDREYWMCDIHKIFGIIRDEKIIMLNGYVMIQDFSEPKIYLHPAFKRTRKIKSSRIMNTGYPMNDKKSLKASINDNVIFDPSKTSQYRIGDKKFRIIKQEHIYGKYVE